MSPSVPEMEGIIICHWGIFFSKENVPLVEFMHPEFARMPGGVTVGH